MDFFHVFAFLPLSFLVVFGTPPLGFYPNIIIFYADDLGFGDLSNYGHPISITPNLDRLVSEGTKILEFYSSSPVCSPSRAALLTGRFQTRSGIWPGVFGNANGGGLPHDEITIANLLKSLSIPTTNSNSTTEYATGIIGKWHLGIGGENGTYLPTSQGFDFYTGIPFSHDMPDPVYCFPGKLGCWPSTWPDPWNDTMRDSFTIYNNNQWKSESQESQMVDVGINNDGEQERLSLGDLTPSERRKELIKQRLLSLNINLDSTNGVITKEMIDEIPPEWRLSENMDLEYVTMLGSGSVELPLYLQNTIIQQPVNITEVPDYYTLNAKYFINNALNKSQPFFLYYAFHETHHPQFSSIKYFNTSQRGMFGDALSEMDYNIGVVMDYLYESGIENETLVIFSADNGPSLMRMERGGNAGLLKCGKGTTWEGGVRVPGIMWMPKYIESHRVTRGLGSTLDVFPTIAELMGVDLPENVTYDGYSMYDWIFTKVKDNKNNKNNKNNENEKAESKRNTVYYWPENVSIDTAKSKGWWTQSMHAVRVNQYKLHWITAGSHCGNTYADIDCRGNSSDTFLDTPLLFNLYHDEAEAYPLQQDSSDKSNNEYYQNLIIELNSTIVPLLQEDDLWGKSQMSPSGEEYQPCCNWGCEDSWPDCCNCGESLMLNDVAKQYWEDGTIIN